MDMDSYTRFALSLILVLGMIFIVAAGLRRFGPTGPGLRTGRGSTRRLRVVEATMVDARRRLMLVRCDDTEHLLLIGGTHDLVVASGLAVPAAPPPIPDSPPPSAAPTGPAFRSLLDRVSGGRP
ncbi:FliO/MopB family protein [Roseospira marina]|uniref:FliO/MopB family protein n=1 Tax=Roseospira marina TaxID=140057 RepID=A0A5M6IHB8_9PROT|nr:flagellar biosynthetic protein FliO [Roseospira marina]KAA5607015.1 FliO/MopB family protein [Roseospira marina]MBB4312800.1 flagellar protein FliO/FliZ [Roseospira marina]MBB5086427.1 flagellar protein FliO/FliZ [Roseospira marina]